MFTEEFGDYVGTYGHGRRIEDAGGDDVLNAAALRSSISMDLRSGSGRIGGERVRLSGVFETVFSGDGADQISGGRAHERLSGGRGDDRLRGGEGNDRLEGGQGEDRVHGGNDADRLFGRQGRDLLVDGRGADVLTGGGGADVFRMRFDGAADRIRDFNFGSDLIALEGLSFGEVSSETLEPGRVRLTYAEEVLIVDDGGRDALRARDLAPEDFLFG